MVMSMFLHERIQQKLDEKHLRQADIARATGKSTVAVTKWLRGENVPKADSLKQIAQLLDTTDEWLLTGKNHSTNSIGDRIRSVRRQKNISQAELAKLANVSQGAISQLESGRNETSKELPQIALALGVDVYWLLTGETSLPAQVQSILDNTAPHVISTDIDPTSKIWLPLMDISFSCGDGVNIECHFEATKKKLAFEPDFLQSRGVKEQNVRLLYARGDSMELFIFDGDVFAIDISDTEIRDGQIYAVYFEGEALLKQVFKEAGGTLVLHSFNSRYRDKIVSENNGASFKVIGRQFWRAG